MNFSNPFKGKISVYGGGKRNGRKHHLSFDITPEEAKVCDTLMCHFHGLDFTEQEKRELTARHRAQIHQYQQVDTKSLRQYSRELNKLIKQNKDEEVVVVASDFGAFICLASIFSGKLPKSSVVRFELSTVPLSLFPKTMVINTDSISHVEISVSIKPDSWLKPFQSLYMDREWEELLDISQATRRAA